MNWRRPVAVPDWRRKVAERCSERVIMPDCPKTILVAQDWGHLTNMGRTSKGQQILFVPLHKSSYDGEVQQTQSYFCTFLFNADGTFQSADIERHISDRPFDIELALRKTELDLIEPCDVTVAPFRIDHDDIAFGLIPVAPDPDDEEDEWYVVLEPGADAVFSAPWDGTYETS